MKRFDIFLDQNRLTYLKRYVEDTTDLKVGVSTVIRMAVDRLLLEHYPDEYQAVNTDGRGKHTRRPRTAKTGV